MSSYRSPRSSGMTIPVSSQPGPLAGISIGRNSAAMNLSDKQTSSPTSQKLSLDELAAKSEQLALAKGIRVSSSRGTRSNTTSVELPSSISNQQHNARNYQPAPQPQPSVAPRYQQHPAPSRAIPPNAQMRGHVPSFHYWMPVPALLHGAKLPPDQRKSLEAAYGRVTPPFPRPMIPTAQYLMSRRVSAPNCLTLAPPAARGTELQPRDGTFVTNPQHGPVRMTRPLLRSAQTHQAAGGSYGRRYSTMLAYPMHLPSAKQQMAQNSYRGGFPAPALQTLSTPAAPAAENSNIQGSRNMSIIKKPHAKLSYAAPRPITSPPTPADSTDASGQRPNHGYQLAQTSQPSGTGAQHPVKDTQRPPVQVTHKPGAHATRPKRSTVIDTIPCPIERLDLTSNDQQWVINAQLSPNFTSKDVFVILLRQSPDLPPVMVPVTAGPGEAIADLSIYMEAMRIEDQVEPASGVAHKDVYSSQASVSLGPTPGIVGSLQVSDVVNGRLRVKLNKAVA